MTQNLSFLDSLFKDLLTAKHSNYSQQCLSLYFDQQKFTIEDLGNIRNRYEERLKCTLIKHREPRKIQQKQMRKNSNRTNLFSQRNQSQNRSRILESNQTVKNINSRCIVYLHGLGSSRLQCLTMVNQLPTNYCICMFDMSGSGKSQGEYVTYGMKEKQDIQPVIDYLQKKRNIKDFVIWGRSMGAVATLLYSISTFSAIPKNDRRDSTIISRHNSFMSSINYDKTISHGQSIYDFNQEIVKAIVIDSPFCQFRDIAKQMARKRLIIPNFILQTGLDYLQQSFDRILQQSIGKRFNPFQISFTKEINLAVPIIVMYSQKDEVIPPTQCMQIIRNIKSRFEKIMINQCTHNSTRPSNVLKDVFEKVDKYHRQNQHQNKKISDSRSLMTSQSCERKRGIFVYTLSKEKDQRQAISNISDQRSLLKLQQTLQVNSSNVSALRDSPPKCYSSQVRTGLIACKRRGLGKQINNFHTIDNTEREKREMKSFMTIDNHINSFIHSKLRGTKENEPKCRLLRSKKLNGEVRNQIRLSHMKYLQ